MKQGRMPLWEIVAVACIVVAIGGGTVCWWARANVAVDLSHRIRPGMSFIEAEKILRDAGFRKVSAIGSGLQTIWVFNRDGTPTIYLTEDQNDSVFAIQLSHREQTLGGPEDWLDWLTGSVRK